MNIVENIYYWIPLALLFNLIILLISIVVSKRRILLFRRKSIYKIAYSIVIGMILLAFGKEGQLSEKDYGVLLENYPTLGIFIIGFSSTYLFLLTLEIISDFINAINKYPQKEGKRYSDS